MRTRRRDRPVLAYALTALAAVGCSNDSAQDEGACLAPAPSAPVCPVADISAPEVVNGDVLIESIEDAEALAGVTTVLGDVTVSDSGDGDLQFLPLGDLVCIQGTLSLGKAHIIECNRSLADIDLRSLRTIGGNLGISCVDALVDLEGLGALETIGGDLYVGSNPALVGVDGMSSLSTVRGYLDIAGNDSLATLVLPGLTVVGGSHLSVTNNPRLATIRLPALECHRYNFRVYGNPSLTQLHMPALVRERVYLEVYDNPRLTDIDLSALESAADLRIIDTLVAELSLTSLIEANSIYVNGAPELASIEAPALTSTTGYVRIENTAVSRLSFGLLSTVGGYIWIRNNWALESLDGLSLVNTIGGSFKVFENGALAELGMDSLEYVGADFVVESNPALPECEAEALLERLLESGFDGEIVLSGNDSAGTCE